MENLEASPDSALPNSTPAPGVGVDGQQEQQNAVAKEATMEDLPQVFNTTKPKDIRDGLGNGLGNLLKGCSFLLLRLYPMSVYLFWSSRRCGRSSHSGLGKLILSRTHPFDMYQFISLMHLPVSS